MNQQNAELIRNAVYEAGDHIKGRLPSVTHLRKRNSYAHIFGAIKDAMGTSYKECLDSQVPSILRIISDIRETCDGPATKGCVMCGQPIPSLLTSCEKCEEYTSDCMRPLL